MKPLQGLGGIMIGGAATMLVAQPGWAAPTQVTNVRVNSTAAGVDVVLETQAGDRPQVFAVKRGNSWTADVINTQLRLPGGSFRQDKPTAGITAVTVAPLDANSIRVTVTGEGSAPSGQVANRSADGLVLSVNRNGNIASTPTPSTLPGTSPAPAPAPSPVAQAPAPAPSPVPAPSPQTPPPLIPNPEIEIRGGTEAPVSPAPPLLPRAVPPPVGDISVSQADTSVPVIDLGTAERVPRLVLREASAREVLSLLARAAGLNVAYVDQVNTPGAEGQQGAQPQQQQPGATATGPRVSLDIENESVQDVFNYIVRITGLEANRIGRTIFVGPRLPDDARNVISRSLRMNQVTATAAANFLVAQGAELQQPINRVTFVPITPPPNPTLSRVEEPDIKVIRAERGLGPLPLTGISVTTDARLNIVTLTGNPQKVSLATSFLSQLDARRRQVAVNVRVIDVNLLANQRFGASFSFGLGNTRFLSTGGLGFINFGNSSPASTDLGAEDVGTGVSTPLGNVDIDTNFSKNFFLQLQALITNGDAKILTDPTLVVQEGQQATINLTQEVVSNFEVETQPGDPPTTTVTIEKEDVGLVLDIAIERIDDNGFVTLAVNPSVTSIGGQQNVNIGNVNNIIFLLQTREVASGQIRVRDNQTLVLAGIIQDSDRANIRKIPILGDIPLLGALFRRTENISQRQEVIVLLTPQIIDDSDRSNFGYNYTPGPNVQRILQQNTTEPGRPNR